MNCVIIVVIFCLLQSKLHGRYYSFYHLRLLPFAFFFSLPFHLILFKEKVLLFDYCVTFQPYSLGHGAVHIQPASYTRYAV